MADFVIFLVYQTNYVYLNTSKGVGLSKSRGRAWPVRGMGAGGGPGQLQLAVDENLEGIKWSGANGCDTFEGGGCEWAPDTGTIQVWYCVM